MLSSPTASVRFPPAAAGRPQAGIFREACLGAVPAPTGTPSAGASPASTQGEADRDVRARAVPAHSKAALLSSCCVRGPVSLPDRTPGWKTGHAHSGVCGCPQQLLWSLNVPFLQEICLPEARYGRSLRSEASRRGQHRARRPAEPGPVSSGSCRRTHRTGPQKRQAPAADSHSTVVSSTWFNGGIPFLTANVIMQHGLCSHPKITILLGFILLLPDYILYLK